jgi:hypothetical protein
VGQRVQLVDITDRKQCDTFRTEIDILLNLMGHPEALVSDQTTLGDFEQYEDIKAVIGDAAPGDFLWELGRKISRYSGD